MQIGNIQIQNKAALAPMAGITDRAFRETCKNYGAAFVVGEMVSAKGLSMHDKKSDNLLQLTDIERPIGVQIFGSEPEVLRQAANLTLKHNPNFVDINMGCPAPKIISGGGGSALMQNPALAEKIIKAVVNEVKIPVTVKFRAGWDSQHINAVEFAKRCENAGASAVTVHGRTKVQMYAPPVDLDIIRQVKESISIPVIGNGDITDGKSAAHMLETTGCDMVMIGRGALGNPWVFYAVHAYLADGTILPQPPLAERMRIMLKHITTMCEYKGERIAMKEARKHVGWYIKGVRGAASYRRDASQLTTLEQLQKLSFKVIVDNQNKNV